MQRAHPVSGDLDHAEVEELDLRHRAPGGPLQHLGRGGALKLVAVELSPAGRVHGRALVSAQPHVVAACLRVELDPVVGGRPSDQPHLALFQEEQDSVPDHIAVGVARHELLGLAGLEARERVHAQIREQPDDVGALDGEVGHVVGLVEEGARLPPRALLVAPVRELARHHRVDVRPDLGVAHVRGASVDHLVVPPRLGATRGPGLTHALARGAASPRPWRPPPAPAPRSRSTRP